ncbi:MAG: hypothetical protein H6850_04670 [Alphaproteobacteria bacterium]|nr:MAG: hypothetical protein H6850_04670 [Alphaproteobacteria bacterium]
MFLLTFLFATSSYSKAYNKQADVVTAAAQVQENYPIFQEVFHRIYDILHESQLPKDQIPHVGLGLGHKHFEAGEGQFVCQRFEEKFGEEDEGKIPVLITQVQSDLKGAIPASWIVDEEELPFEFSDDIKVKEVIQEIDKCEGLRVEIMGVISASQLPLTFAVLARSSLPKTTSEVYLEENYEDASMVRPVNLSEIGKAIITSWNFKSRDPRECANGACITYVDMFDFTHHTGRKGRLPPPSLEAGEGQK